MLEAPLLGQEVRVLLGLLRQLQVLEENVPTGALKITTVTNFAWKHVLLT